MSDMQTSAVFLGQSHSLLRRSKTGLLAAYHRMKAHGRVFTPRFLRRCHIAIDDVAILAMNHQRQLASLENLLQNSILVDQHIARRRTHKEFDARNAARIQLGKSIAIIVCGAIEERVVHVTFRGCQDKLLFQSLGRGGLRLGVRHIKEGCHTSCRCRLTLCVYIGLLRQSGFTEMHVTVNHARQHIAPCSVNDVITSYLFLLTSYLNNSAVFHDDIALKDAAFIDNFSSFYQCAHGSGTLAVPFMRASFSCAVW